MVEYKGFSIDYEGRFPKFLIKRVGKGALPKELKGSYRSKHSAMQAIDTYENLKQKDTSNDKKASAAGS